MDRSKAWSAWRADGRAEALLDVLVDDQRAEVVRRREDRRLQAHVCAAFAGSFAAVAHAAAAVRHRTTSGIALVHGACRRYSRRTQCSGYVTHASHAVARAMLCRMRLPVVATLRAVAVAEPSYATVAVAEPLRRRFIATHVVARAYSAPSRRPVLYYEYCPPRAARNGQAKRTPACRASGTDVRTGCRKRESPKARPGE